MRSAPKTRRVLVHVDVGAARVVRAEREQEEASPPRAVAAVDEPVPQVVTEELPALEVEEQEPSAPTSPAAEFGL